MSDLEQICGQLIAEFGTRNDEHAFHNLIELGPQILSILMLTFKNEQRPAIRCRLVEAISEFRDPATIEFLEHASDDTYASVWKASLDGLVSIGGPAATATLRRVQQKE